MSTAVPAIILAVANQKGGVAKTTTSINLATGLALAGFPTLLIDCDPQANATSGLGIAREFRQKSTYDVLTNGIPVSEAAVSSRVKNLSVVPSSRNLIGANVELVNAESREFRLRDALQPVLDHYAFVVMDCPPALDLLTLNALCAANLLLVPMQAEYFALEGVSELLNTVERVRSSLNPNLVLDAVVLTMFDERTNLAQQVADNLRGYFGDRLMKTTVPRNIRLAEAPSHGMPVAIYDPRSRGAEAYRELTAELLARWGRLPQHTASGAGLLQVRTSAVSQDMPDAPNSEKTPEKKVRFWPYG